MLHCFAYSSYPATLLIPYIIAATALGLTQTEQQHTISTLTEVSTWATLVGSLFIVSSYLAFKEIRHFHLRLVFFLAIADFFVSIVFILNLHIDISNYVTCEILAGALQFFELSSSCWAFCIAFVLDQVIRANNYAVETYEKYFHMFSWGFPAVTVIIAHFQGLFGNAGLWCWIQETDKGLFRWLYFYLPLVLILIYVVVVYTVVSRKIRRQLSVSATFYQTNNETTIQQTFRWYIIGWVICWMPAIVDRIQDMIWPNDPIYVLTAMHAFFAPLAGFCNSIALGFNDEIQAQYLVLFHRIGIARSKSLGKKGLKQDKDSKILNEILREYDESDEAN